MDKRKKSSFFLDVYRKFDDQKVYEISNNLKEIQFKLCECNYARNNFGKIGFESKCNSNKLKKFYNKLNMCRKGVFQKFDSRYSVKNAIYKVPRRLKQLQNLRIFLSVKQRIPKKSVFLKTK